MEDKVQLHVDVPRPLWKAIKQAALDGGDTLKGIVEKALDKRFMAAVDGRKPMDQAEPIRELCSHCGESVVASKMMVHPRTGKRFCPDCVENMKSGQA